MSLKKRIPAKLKELDWSKFGVERTRKEIEDDLKGMLNSTFRIGITKDNYECKIDKVADFFMGFYEVSGYKFKNIFEIMEALCVVYRMEDKTIERYQEILSKEL